MDATYIRSLMALIETQSKQTLAYWCLDYTTDHILPIYETAYPGDHRCRHALEGARQWLAGQVTLPYAKDIILNECHAAARECDGEPAVQAAARTCGQAASTIHAPTHALGLALYGTLAVAYDECGADAPWEILVDRAGIECAKMEEALRCVAIDDEPNPAKINWKC